MHHETLDTLLQVLPAGNDQPDRYVGQPYDYGPLRIYGGHFIGQALAAALATVPDDRACHSLHAYFLKAGDPGEPIHYDVERLKDGGYMTRVVRASQRGESVFFMTASFKPPEAGDTHQPVMPSVVTAGERIEARQLAGDDRFPFPFTIGTSVEIEVLDDWTPRNPRRDSAPIRLWMRAGLKDSTNPRLQQCALAYLSDSTLLFNALRRHGQPFGTHRITSLDHALWFHQTPDCTDWLLFDQSGVAAADGRGINTGYLFRQDGVLIATAAQESMMRRVAPQSG